MRGQRMSNKTSLRGPRESVLGVNTQSGVSKAVIHNRR